MKKFLLITIIMFPLTSFASNSHNYFAYTLKAFGSLAIVIALMLFAMYLLKKINISSRFKSGRINVTDRLYIDNKHSIVIVKIDNKVFALGVGENINVITQLKSSEGKKDIENKNNF